MAELVIATGKTIAGTATAAQAATAATTAALAAAGTSAYMSVQQGRAYEKQGEFQAELAEREAQTVKEAGEYEERQSRVEGRQLRARQMLQFAKGGVVPGTGTPLLVGGQTAADTARSITLQKYGYGLQHTQSMSQSKLYRMMGKSRSRASRWQAGSSLLTGAYRASSIWQE